VVKTIYELPVMIKFIPTYNLGAMALSSITPTNLTVPKKI
jgi:hypothetical protein